MSKSKYILPAFTFLLIVFAWEFLPALLKVPSYIFPRLSEIYSAITSAKSNLVTHVTITFYESCIGFLIGSGFGFLMGISLAQSKTVSRITLPYVVATNAIPVIAIAPIIILWFGHGIMSKAFVSAFLCFFPLVINTYKGLSQYDKIYGELFLLYGSSKKDFLLKFKLQNAIPFIISGLKLNATYSVVGAIVAEFIGANAGLGFGMLQASYNLNSPRLWGYIIVSCALGLSMYSLMYLLEIYIVKKHFNHAKNHE